MGKKSRSQGFTLVEMLVVVTIIAVLVTMMVMGVQSAVRAAQKAKCQNFEHEIVSAILQFESEHGCFPGYSNKLGNRNVSWAVMILDYIDQHDLWITWLNGSSTSQNVKTFVCPGEIPTTTAVSSYFPNGQIFVDRSNPSNPNSPIFTRSNISNSSATALLFETAPPTSWTSVSGLPTVTTTSIQSGTGTGGSTGGATMIPVAPKSQHFNGGNVGFCDGHVEFIQNQ
jgi:prepilin-type N-terminal cleavage/methylation domain-containing protein/prepilin-type processing-associated H-X9-DG protein